MSRTLVLLRHGKSGYPPGVTDHGRPLAERGRREAALAGRWMSDEGLHVDAVLCSTATRTRETLDRTGVVAPGNHAPVSHVPVSYVDDIYGGTPYEILEALRLHAPANAATVLVVGHSPGMPDTALTLDPDGSIAHFPTSAYAVLTIGVSWDRIGLDVDPDARLVGVRIPRD